LTGIAGLDAQKGLDEKWTIGCTKFNLQ